MVSPAEILSPPNFIIYVSAKNFRFRSSNWFLNILWKQTIPDEFYFWELPDNFQDIFFSFSAIFFKFLYFNAVLKKVIISCTIRRTFHRKLRTILQALIEHTKCWNTHSFWSKYVCSAYENSPVAISSNQTVCFDKESGGSSGCCVTKAIPIIFNAIGLDRVADAGRV